MITYYLYRLINSLKFDKCGATNDWDKRCTDNRREHGPQCTITLLETMEGPNTPEFWQVVGDREWELADQYEYPRGTHYRIARERRRTWTDEDRQKSYEAGVHRLGGLALKGKPKAAKYHTKEHTNPATLASSQKVWTCEHCNTTGKHTANYSRWHGDNCKLNPKKGL